MYWGRSSSHPPQSPVQAVYTYAACTQDGSASLENSSLPSNGKIDNDREKGEEEMGQRISANTIKSLWGWENLSQSVQTAGLQQIRSQPWYLVHV